MSISLPVDDGIPDTTSGPARRRDLRRCRWTPGSLWTRYSRVARYGAASFFTTVTSLVLLAVLLQWTTPGWANLVAVGAGSIISFELNRGWVWKRSNSTVRHVQRALFVATSVGFLGLSVLAAHEVGGTIPARDGDAWRATVIEATTVAVFGVRWVLQFFLLDRVLFRSPPAEEPGTAESADLLGQVAVTQDGRHAGRRRDHGPAGML